MFATSTQSRLGPAAAGRLQALLTAQRGQCFYCGLALSLRAPGAAASAADATIDHFYPRAEGGLDNWRNWVLCCAACNNRKAHRLPTVDEIERWNALAGSWQVIEPIDLSLLETRRCTACDGWINPARLGASLRSRHPTKTCRPLCRRRIRPSPLTPSRRN